MSNPIITISMENGDVIKAELYPEIAPNTVANFVNLVESCYFDGLIFHRVIPGFMVQGGDPTGTGTGGPGWSIRGEFEANGHPNDIIHAEGILSMARSQHKDSAGSQFFIMVEDAPHLNGQYAGFGKVIEGMEGVNTIVNAPVESLQTNRPKEPSRIKTVTVDTGDVKYSVEKLMGI